MRSASLAAAAVHGTPCPSPVRLARAGLQEPVLTYRLLPDWITVAGDLR